MARLLCPVRSMATRSGTLARIRLRAAVRRQSWRKRVGTPAAWQAVRHAVRQRRTGIPSRWKKTSRYQQQARVENACFRYTSIIGDGLRAKTPGGRTAETLLTCNILNTMTAMGRPNSYAMGR